MATTAELRALRDDRRADYTVRTRFVDSAGEPRFVNHLIGEESPYLLQHAHNPVDWYPWGEAAFAKAAAEDKPIFLSIGYSTCHWCHVMEEESFDDEEVAAALNRDFVSIKVDREQRPDLDEYYMAGVQIVTGRGGWPMSSLLTPDARPFFGGTYFPKANFLSLLENARQAWQNQRERIRADADNLDRGIRQQLTPAAAGTLPDDLVERAVAALVRHADSEHGGFGEAPKFPQEPNLRLLAEHVARDTRPLADQPAWIALRDALDAMRAGGIHDQIGGGFHRYATDAAWQVPHFEKMLYNQGQLADVYLQAWQLCAASAYRRVVEDTLDYVIREMQAPDGGFYSATDADSEGEEGRFFVWRHEELDAALDADSLAFCETVFGASRAGNFEGANILHLPRSLAASAAELGLSREDFDRQLATLKQRLYAIREQREAPLRDDKHIAEWNAMVVGALARAGRALVRADYIEAAERAAGYLWQVHFDTDAGLLWRTSLEGKASVAGQLEDYAHCIDALTALYDATEDSAWLERARALLDSLIERHWDRDDGGFFTTAEDQSGPQPMRSKSLMDNATISGNSLMPQVLLALYGRLGEPALRERADAQIAAFSGHIAALPLAGPVFLQSLLCWASPTPDALQYLGDGAVRAQCRLEALDADRWHAHIDLHIRAGWHLQPLGEADPATQLTVAAPKRWQAGTVESRPANEDTLSGAVTLSIDTRRLAPGPLVLELRAQPCTDRECLPSETRRFVLHIAEADATTTRD